MHEELLASQIRLLSFHFTGEDRGLTVRGMIMRTTPPSQRNRTYTVDICDPTGHAGGVSAPQMRFYFQQAPLAQAAVTHMRSQLSASAGRPGDAALTELAGIERALDNFRASHRWAVAAADGGLPAVCVSSLATWMQGKQGVQ